MKGHRVGVRVRGEVRAKVKGRVSTCPRLEAEPSRSSWRSATGENLGRRGLATAPRARGLCGRSGLPLRGLPPLGLRGLLVGLGLGLGLGSGSG